MSKPGPRWTTKEVAALKAMAQTYPTEEIASKLGRSVGALAVKAHQLKLSLRLKRKDGVSPSASPDPGPAGFSWEPARNRAGNRQ